MAESGANRQDRRRGSQSQNTVPYDTNALLCKYLRHILHFFYYQNFYKWKSPLNSVVLKLVLKLSFCSIVRNVSRNIWYGGRSARIRLSPWSASYDDNITANSTNKLTTSHIKQQPWNLGCCSIPGCEFGSQPSK